MSPIPSTAYIASTSWFSFPGHFTFSSISRNRIVAKADQIGTGALITATASQISRPQRPIGQITLNIVQHPSIITIPSSETRISSYAFNGNSLLHTLILPDTITAMESFAFSGAPNLRTIVIDSATAPVVQSNTFSGVSINNLTVFVPVGSGNLYKGASGWSGVTIKEMYDVHTLIDGSLRLNKINFPVSGSYDVPERIRTVENIVQNSSSVSFSRINRPVAVIGNGSNIFATPTTISEITFSQNGALHTIGNSAFFGCSELYQITIPDSVTSIGTNAFHNNINVIWQGNIEFKAGVLTKYIGSQPKYTVPSFITSISSSAFKNTICNEITIPDSVLSIGAYTFEGCSNLQIVYIKRTTALGSITTLGAGAFANCPVLSSIYVLGDMCGYKTSANWANYSQFVKPYDSTVNNHTCDQWTLVGTKHSGTCIFCNVKVTGVHNLVPKLIKGKYYYYCHECGFVGGEYTGPINLWSIPEEHL